MRFSARVLTCLLLAACVFAGNAALALANDKAPAPGNTVDEKAADTNVVETSHELRIGGETLHYKARAGELLVEHASDKANGRFFFVAYELEGTDGNLDRSNRPITFAFNGGPGASAVWLHLGCMGPERLAMGPDGNTLPPPARLVPNEQSWLPFTDMVFIDPVGTGYSRAEAPKGQDKDKAPDSKAFWGVRQDVGSVAEFIRLYLTRYQRWASPKFLAGESYGTTRAAALSRYLMDTQGIALNGVTLLSPVLAFDTIWGDGMLPSVLVLPSYAASAKTHGLGAYASLPLEELVAKARAYASGPYLTALFKGSSLSKEEREARDKEVAAFTGLPLADVEQQEGAIPVVYFLKNLLRKDGLMLSRYDGTITGIDSNPGNPFHMAYDPNLDLMGAALSEAANAYYRGALGYENNAPYEVISNEVNRMWDWSSGLHGGQGFINTADDLAVALTANPALHVFIGGGYYDMTTPSFATEYTLDQMGLAPAVRKRVDLRNYLGGHMFYAHEDALKQFTADIRTFYSQTLQTKTPNGG